MSIEEVEGHPVQVLQASTEGSQTIIPVEGSFVTAMVSVIEIKGSEMLWR